MPIDAAAQEQIISSLKLLDTHMSYLREEVSKIADLQDALQDFKVQQVKRGAELKAIRESHESLAHKMDNLAQKIDGTPGAEPLPSRVRTLETRITKLEGPQDADPVPSRLRSLEEEVGSLKGQLKDITKSESDLKKERLKAWVSIGLALISMIGGVLAASISLFAN